jgi:hypothetical protein
METVTCVAPAAYKLTVGKEYTVTEGGTEELYDVIDDQGIARQCFKWRFEPLKNPSKLPEGMKLKGPAKENQIGGSHYTKLKIQPYEYCMANGIPYVESNAIKYLTRWRDKGGVEDLKKAIHSIQWLIEYTEKQTSEGS